VIDHEALGHGTGFALNKAKEPSMGRLFIFVAVILGLAVANARAADAPLLPPPLPSEDAARLLAREMAARVPRGYVNGQFVPTIPRAMPPKSAAKAEVSPCGQTATNTPAPSSVVENGMRFFPIHNGASPRDFRLAGRGTENAAAHPTPDAAAKSTVSALADAAVQTTLPSIEVDALQMTEADMVTDPADPTANAKQAVLDEIRRFRTSRGLP